MRKIYFWKWHDDKANTRKKIKTAFVAVSFLVFLVIIQSGIYWPALFVIAADVAVVFFYRKYLREPWKMSNLFQQNIDWFVKQNALAKTHEETRMKGDKSVQCTVADYLPNILYCWDKDTFLIKFLCDGSEISKNFNSYGDRLADIFDASLSGCEKKDGYIVYTFLRGKDARLFVTDDMKGMFSKDSIRITGNLWWKFRKVPHALITGGTGSGKTFLLTYLVAAFQKLGSVKLIDPKRSDLSQFGEFVGDEKVACSTGEIAKLLREAVETMNQRYEEFKKLPDYGFGKDYSDYKYRPFVIFFDEIMACMGSADTKTSKEIMGFLTELIAKGRQAGVFMVLSAQRMDGKYLDPSIRDQLSLRLALGRMTPDGYQMVFGSEGRDLQLTDYQKGDGFIYIDGTTSVPVQFSAPYIGSEIEYINFWIMGKRAEKQPIQPVKG